MTDTTDRATLRQFINSTAITMTADRADENPHMASPMPAGSSHYKCVLKCGRRQMLVYFSQGPAICKEPTVQDVLNCLAMDASGYENAQSFEDWARDYGYDPDSRTAERTFKIIEKQAGQLKRLLYDDQTYQTLLYDVELD